MEMDRSHSSQVMDTILYEAVNAGDTKTIEQYKDELLHQLTPNKNTVLHVAAQFHLFGSNVIDAIFEEQSSITVKSMLTQQNSEGETALYIATKIGGHDFVASLIQYAKDLDKDPESGAGVVMEMLRMTNKYGDTALHEAVRHNDIDTIKLLVEEDPKFRHPSNDMEETPLYLAVESHFHGVLELILRNCVSPSYNGPKSRTALHAAIISECQECMTKLLEEIPGLSKEVDAFEWTPLHYAALFNFEFAATKLLEADCSLAHYTANKDDKQTALHVAAINGSLKVMKEILKYRPDCWEMITDKGHNILHLAVHYEMRKALKFILSKPWSRVLVNQKDLEGNTPLHLEAASKWFRGHVLLREHRANLNAFNKKNHTPLDVFWNTDDPITYEKRLIEDMLIENGANRGDRNVIMKENGVYIAQRKNIITYKNDVPVDPRKVSDTHLIVAALTATVTFAAGFTMPGGYIDDDGPDHGRAVLFKRVAFKTFVISDAIAMISSIIAVSLHLAAASRQNSRDLHETYDSAVKFIKLSLIAMVIAFTTGIYTVLPPSSTLGITVCVIGGFALLIFSAFVPQIVINFMKGITIAAGEMASS